MVAQTPPARCRAKVFRSVLLSLASPGLENGVIILWEVFWAAFDIRFFKIRTARRAQSAHKKSKRKSRNVSFFSYADVTIGADRIGLYWHLRQSKTDW